MRYFVDNEQVSKEEFESALEDAVREHVEDNYDDLIDETFDEVKIGCCTFYPSRILKELDPIAYNCGIDDFVDGELSDAKCNFEIEYEEDINGVEFRTEYDEEEEE